MLSDGRWLACSETGFVPAHAEGCGEVAERTNTIILFREPGKMARGLIEENYAMKGFRIDTKSCDWGPMSGFVCVDPRLTKDPKYAVPRKNILWTKQAVDGDIEKKYFGAVDDPTWKAGVVPIVISQRRVDFLEKNGKINPLPADDGYVGESTATNGTFVFQWRLVAADGRPHPWLKGGVSREHFVVCADNRGEKLLSYPGVIKPIRFEGYETVLGITNPGTAETLGFKACVTADYDLLSVWPGPPLTVQDPLAKLRGPDDAMAIQHNLQNQVQHLKDRLFPIRRLVSEPVRSTILDPLPGGVPRQINIDARPKQGGNFEHHRYGDISNRILNVKVLLNSTIIGKGYQGGNAVHHNDEVGNTALAKGSLSECLPIVGFAPKSFRFSGQTVLIRSIQEFRELFELAKNCGFSPLVKKEWGLAAS
jgi:hypothetical protein